jgi:hypothetical protein
LPIRKDAWKVSNNSNRQAIVRAVNPHDRIHLCRPHTRRNEGPPGLRGFGHNHRLPGLANRRTNRRPVRGGDTGDQASAREHESSATSPTREGGTHPEYLLCAECWGAEIGVFGADGRVRWSSAGAMRLCDARSGGTGAVHHADPFPAPHVSNCERSCTQIRLCQSESPGLAARCSRARPGGPILPPFGRRLDSPSMFAV